MDAEPSEGEEGRREGYEYGQQGQCAMFVLESQGGQEKGRQGRECGHGTNGVYGRKGKS